MSKKSSPFFDHNIVETSKSSNIQTSCCIDTTKITAGPCSSEIQTSYCIDTTKE